MNIISVGWRAKLESEFLPELALVSITRDDLDRARYYVNQYYSNFLSKWTSLHPLAYAGRHLKLQSVQRAVELEEFLNFVRYHLYTLDALTIAVTQLLICLLFCQG